MRRSWEPRGLGIQGAVLALVPLMLSGCAGYSVEGVRYRSANAALKAQSVALEEQVVGVVPLGYVGGSILLPFPPDSELTRPPYAQRRVPRISPAHSYYVRYWKRHITAAAETLGRAEAFDSVETRRVDDPWAYARDYGYRFIVRDEGPRWFLQDTVSGASRELHGVGLKDLGQRAQAAASLMQTNNYTASARNATASAEPPVQDKSGGFTLGSAGAAFEARARILARIRTECSGSYRIDDEFLQDGILTLRFDCLGSRVSAR